MTGRRRRQRECGVGAAVARRHRGECDGDSGRGGGGSHAPEHRVPGLVRDEHGQRHEHRRLVQHDVRRVRERDLRDECQEGMPEREGVTGVEPAVGELVHGREREVAELEQLANARQVEQAVTADLTRYVPEQQSEHDAGRPDRGLSRDRRHVGVADREGRRHDCSDRKQDERHPQRRVDHEHDARCREHDPEAPGESRRRAPHADRAGRDRAGGEHEARRSRQPHEQEQRGHRSISERTLPARSQRAASRYIAPRDPRTTRPRRAREMRNSDRTRSASAAP